jgi:hypothetical protein
MHARTLQQYPIDRKQSSCSMGGLGLWSLWHFCQCSDWGRSLRAGAFLQKLMFWDQGLRMIMSPTLKWYLPRCLFVPHSFSMVFSETPIFFQIYTLCLPVVKETYKTGCWLDKKQSIEGSVCHISSSLTGVKQNALHCTALFLCGWFLAIVYK